MPDAKRLKVPETENARLKKLPAESMLENEVTRGALRNMVSDQPDGAAVGMSASSLRYQPRLDRNAELLRNYSDHRAASSALRSGEGLSEAQAVWGADESQTC